MCLLVFPFFPAVFDWFSSEKKKNPGDGGLPFGGPNLRGARAGQGHRAALPGAGVFWPGGWVVFGETSVVQGGAP